MSSNQTVAIDNPHVLAPYLRPLYDTMEDLADPGLLENLWGNGQIEVDLPGNTRAGLGDTIDILGNIEDIGVTEFDSGDVVRHPLVRKIIDAYESRL